MCQLVAVILHLEFTIVRSTDPLNTVADFLVSNCATMYCHSTTIPLPYIISITICIVILTTVVHCWNFECQGSPLKI